eukprot:s100_g17.t1
MPMLALAGAGAAELGLVVLVWVIVLMVVQTMMVSVMRQLAEHFDGAVPFTLQPEARPRGSGAKLATRPVAANGGLFDLHFEEARLSPCECFEAGLEFQGPSQNSVEVVHTVFFSPKPERTAQAISKVLAQRLAETEEPDVECSIS